jgi:hypothetical protein
MSTKTAARPAVSRRQKAPGASNTKAAASYGPALRMRLDGGCSFADQAFCVAT